MLTYRLKRQVVWQVVADDEAEIELPYEPDEGEWEGIMARMFEQKSHQGGARSMRSILQPRNAEPIAVHWQEVDLDNPLDYGGEEVVDVSYEWIDEEVGE